MLQPDTLPAVIAGPLLRRLEPQRLVIWLVGSRALPLCLRLQLPSGETLDTPLMRRTAKSCLSGAMPLST